MSTGSNVIININRYVIYAYIVLLDESELLVTTCVYGIICNPDFVMRPTHSLLKLGTLSVMCRIMFD